MNGENLKLKSNVDLVETVFRIKFEVLWVAPCDRRYGMPVFVEFGRCAQEAARLLCSTDLATASSARAGDVIRSTERLCESVQRIASVGIFDSDQTRIALTEACRIDEEVKNRVLAGCCEHA